MLEWSWSPHPLPSPKGRGGVIVALRATELPLDEASGLDAHAFCFLKGLVDAAHHVERLLRQRVALALDDHAEAADRLLERHVLALRAGEHFGDVERLREEALDLARARD